VIAVHAASTLAIFIAFAVALARGAVDDPGMQSRLLEIHRWCGELVFAFLVVRVGMRMASPPPTPAEMPLWMEALSQLVQLALYALLYAQPILGWALTNAQGYSVQLPFGLDLPQLIAADPGWAADFLAWHAAAAWMLAGLIALHVAAALFHHYVRRDDVLRAMWFERRDDVAARHRDGLSQNGRAS
jgi:cytochrome b561